MQGGARPKPAHRRHALLWLPALLAALLFAASAQAAPGRLDRSFGHDGTAPADLGPSYRSTSFQAIEAQSDGALLATRDGGIWRYRADGSFDTSFPRRQAPDPRVRAVQEDGKVLTVTGVESGFGNRLLRTNPDGSADPSFSGAPVPISIREIIPLPSGKILVAGHNVFQNLGKAGSIEQIALARFEADGALDPSFGSGGMVRLRSDYGIETAELSGVSPRPGEAAVVLTSTSLIGLTGSGQLDPAYGSAGSVKLDGAPVGFHAVSGGGLLLVEAPTLNCCESNDFVLARYTISGALDPSFGGGDGIVSAATGGIDRATTVRWEDDGSVLVGGSLVTPPVLARGCPYPTACLETPALTRFTAGGLLDSGFGTDGTVKLDPLTASVSFLGSMEAGVRALALRPGGGLFAGGGSGPGTSVAFLAALNGAGQLESAFGEGGIVRERDPFPSWSEAAGLAVTGDGSILVGGETNAGPSSGLLAVARYQRNGALDRQFGGGGGFVRVPTPLGDDWHLNALACDRRGRPLLLSGKSTVTRLTRDGQLDSSFGREGSARLKPSGELHALATLHSGAILVAGSVIAGHHSSRMSVFRLYPNGRLDRSFGHRGMATVRFGGKGHSAVRQLAIQPNGRILLAGYVRDSMALARLMPDGALDRSFGRGGRIVPPVGQQSKATAVATQGGKILLAGWLRRAGKARALLLRYSSDGRLDRRFARGGISSSFAVAPASATACQNPPRSCPPAGASSSSGAAKAARSSPTGATAVSIASSATAVRLRPTGSRARWGRSNTEASCCPGTRPGPMARSSSCSA